MPIEIGQIASFLSDTLIHVHVYKQLTPHEETNGTKQT